MPLRLADKLQVGRGQHAQQRIAELAAGKLLRVILYLIEQHRHKIHHAVDLRMALEMRRHIDIILDGVQIDPGQDEFSGRRIASADFCGHRAMIAIIRLVHVPEKNQVEGFHHRESVHRIE